MHHLHEEVDGLLIVTDGLMEASLGRIWQHNQDRALLEPVPADCLSRHLIIPSR